MAPSEAAPDIGALVSIEAASMPVSSERMAAPVPSQARAAPASKGALAAPLSYVAGPIPAGAEVPDGPRIDAMDWDQLRAAVGECRSCGLCRSRSRTVFGSGAQDSPWMIVGEAPGAEEDARGEPFVGQAGRLLENMLAALGLSRERDVFIANVLKCRPPGNRNPEPEEVQRCEPFLHRQVALLRPRGILVMGRFAAQTLLRTDATIASLRGRVHAYPVAGTELPMVVTYHPAYLLRNLADKSKAWADLCLARERFGPGATPPA